MKAKFPHALVSVFAASLFFTANSQAQTRTWDGGGGNDNWTTTANWDNDAVPENTADVIFGTAFTSGNSIDLIATRTVNSFTIDTATAFSIIGGNNLTLTAGLLTRNDVSGTEGNHCSPQTSLSERTESSTSTVTASPPSTEPSQTGVTPSASRSLEMAYSFWAAQPTPTTATRSSTEASCGWAPTTNWPMAQETAIWSSTTAALSTWRASPRRSTDFPVMESLTSPPPLPRPLLSGEATPPLLFRHHHRYSGNTLDNQDRQRHTDALRNNSFSGTLTISAGTLVLTNDSAAGVGTMDMDGGTISGGGVGTRTFNNNLTFSANSTFDGNDLIFTDSFDQGGNRIHTVNNTTEFSGSISGSDSLTKSGTGTLILSGDNTLPATSSDAVALNAGEARSGWQTTGLWAAPISERLSTDGGALELIGGRTIGAEALSLRGSGVGRQRSASQHQRQQSAGPETSRYRQRPGPPHQFGCGHIDDYRWHFRNRQLPTTRTLPSVVRATSRVPARSPADAGDIRLFKDGGGNLNHTPPTPMTA